MKYISIIAAAMLAGCSAEFASENQAHRAWLSTCIGKSIRYQTSEKPNEFMAFTATCQRNSE